jgi:hypothetical protein
MVDFLGFTATAAMMVLAINAIITLMDVFAKRVSSLALLAKAFATGHCWNGELG